MASAEVVVVGGGLIGMLTARELALAELSVKLLERGDTGRESSWAGGGILSPLYPWRYPDAVSELARWGQARYPALAEELALESGCDPELTRSGLLVLGCDADERDSAVDWAVHFDQDLESVTADTLKRLEPALGEADEGGLWLPSVAQVRNPRLLQAVRGSLRQLGVEVEEGSEVLGIEASGGRLTGLRTSAGVIPCEQAVIAGGAWSGELLAPLGCELPVRPVRGQMLLYRGQPGALERIILSQDRYVIPRRDGRVLVGSTLEEVGFDKSTTGEARAELEAAAARIVPALAEMEVEKHWAGLRPGSPDGIPYIGPVPQLPGLFVNTGHFRNGVVLGPASVRLLVDQITGTLPILDPTPYRIPG